MVIFHCKLLVHQRVTPPFCSLLRNFPASRVWLPAGYSCKIRGHFSSYWSDSESCLTTSKWPINDDWWLGDHKMFQNCHRFSRHLQTQFSNWLVFACFSRQCSHPYAPNSLHTSPLVSAWFQHGLETGKTTKLDWNMYDVIVMVNNG